MASLQIVNRGPGKRRAALLLGGTALVGVLALMAPPASAQSTWQAGGAPGDYNDNANWNNATPPVAGGQSAIFNGGGTAAVNLTAPPITPDSWTISGAQSYTFTGGTVNFGAAAGLTNTSTVAQTINSILGGATAVVTQNGTGELILNGANTYGGGTSIASGVVTLGSATASLGSGDVTFTGGTLRATANVAINNGLIFGPGDNGRIQAATGTTLTISSGVHSFFGDVSFGGGGNNGVVVLSSSVGSNIANSADFVIDSGTLRIGNITSTSITEFANSTTVNGTLDINGFNLTVANLSGGATGVITTSAAGAVTLTVANPAVATAYNGAITDGAGSIALSKTGAQTFTLGGSGLNTYSGTTSVTAGTLAASAANVFSANSTHNVFGAGTLDLGGFNQTLGALAGAGLVVSTGNAANNTLTVGGNNANSTFSGAIQDGAGAFTTALVKTGTGTMFLPGANTYEGGTTINQGVINAQNNSALGTGAVLVNAGAALEVQNAIAIANALTLNGTGVANGGALRQVTGGAVYNGAITLASDARINSDSGQLVITGGITGAGQNLTLGGAGTVIVNSAITTGTGGLTKDGSGSSSLSGANTYTGVTTVNAGALTLGGGAAIADTGAVVINGGALGVSASETIGSLAGASVVTFIGGGAVTLTTGGDNTSTTFSGVIGEIATVGALTKLGAGTFTLTGANTYSGGTNLTQGGLAVGNNSALGTGGLTVTGASALTNTGGTSVTLANAVNLNANQLTLTSGVGGAGSNLRLDGVISGVGGSLAVNRASVSTVVLTGNNTFTGGVSLNAGLVPFASLTIGSNTALGTGALTVNEASNLLTSNAVNAGPFTVANNVVLNDSLVIAVGGAGSPDLTLSGAISGGSSLNKTGVGVLTLTGNNSYGDGTSMDAGTLNANASNSLGTGAVTVNGGTLNIAAATTQTVASVTNTAGGGGVINNAGALNAPVNNQNGTTFNNTGTVNGTLANSGNVTNNAGAFWVGNVVNASTGVIANAGTWTGDVANGGQITNTGTWNGDVNNAVGGVIINGAGGVWNGAVTGTADIINSGTYNAGGAVNAINGTITNMGAGVFTVTGTLTAASTFTNSDTAQFNVAAGGVVTGITTLTNSSVVNVAGTLTAGAVNNLATGVINVAVGGTLNDALTNAGLVNNNGNYNADVASNTGTINNNATGIWTGNVLSSSGIINNTGTWTGNIVNSGTFTQTAGSVSNGLNNSGTANVSGGAINGASVNSGTFNVNGNITGNNTFTNAGGGIFNLTGGNFTGLTNVNNSGVINFAGARSLGAAAVANNGTLVAANATSSLTVGSLTGNGTLAAQFSGGSASLVTVTGGSAGTQAITFNGGAQTLALLQAPVTVLDLNGGALQVTNTGLVANLSNNFANTFLVQNGPGGDAFLQSQLNVGPVSGLATSLNAVVSSLNVGFFQAASAIVSRPDDPRPNQIGGGPFIRLSAGDSRVTLNGSATGGGIATLTGSRTTMDYSGFQVGADIGVYNINATGWNFNFGAFGGVAEAKAKGRSTTGAGAFATVVNTSLNVKVPYVALYTFLSNGPFTAEVNVRRDFYDGVVSSVSGGTTVVNPNTTLKGLGWSINGNVSYRFPVFETWYVEPVAGITKGRYSFSSVQFASNPNDVISFDTTDSWLGRAGLNIGTNFQVGEKLILAPFLHGSVWHEFAKASTAQAQVAGLSFTASTDRVGTFGQVGGGLQFKVLDTAFLGFIRGDVRFGERVSGKALNVGLKMQF